MAQDGAQEEVRRERGSLIDVHRPRHRAESPLGSARVYQLPGREKRPSWRAVDPELSFLPLDATTFWVLEQARIAGEMQRLT